MTFYFVDLKLFIHADPDILVKHQLNIRQSFSFLWYSVLGVRVNVLSY